MTIRYTENNFKLDWKISSDKTCSHVFYRKFDECPVLYCTAIYNMENEFEPF